MLARLRAREDWIRLDLGTPLSEDAGREREPLLQRLGEELGPAGPEAVWKLREVGAPEPLVEGLEAVR